MCSNMLRLLVLCALGISAFGGSLHHRMLILSKPAFAEVDWLTQAMDAYGIPYDLVTVADDATPSSALSTSAFWTHADGAGKYSGIFMTPDLETDGTLKSTDISTMWNYTAANSVRTVKINAWAWNHGYTLDNVGSADPADGTFAAGALALAPVANLNPAAKLPLSGLWRIPGTAVSNTCQIVAADTGVAMPANDTCKSVTPVIQAAPIPGSSFQGTTTLAWMATWSDGREVFVTVHPCAAWSTACTMLAHYTLAWVSKGLLAGRRITTLNTQIDDLFLSTEDAITGVGFRANNLDFTTHVNWLKTINTAMPAGSAYRPEFAFNGNGIIAKVDPTYSGLEKQFDIDNEDCAGQPIYSQLGCNCYLMDYFANTCTSPHAFCKACQKNYPKPLNTGARKLPKTYAEYTAGWNKAAFAVADPLFAAIASNAGSFATSFFYCHHTFTHQNLDNVTLEDAVMQIKLNQLMAGPDYLGLTSRSTWSSLAMVTPQISGLANGDALAGLYSTGVRAVMGDNTFAYNLNSNPYLMPYTTAASSNYPGFPIIPRFATEIYFNTTNVAGNLQLYNNIYNSVLGTSTWAQILDREVARVVPQAMLKLRHDAHMFHQANLNTVNSGAGVGKSLLMGWVEAVVTSFKSYAAWPIVSYKADDLLALYKQFEGRDACNFDYTITTNDANGNIQSITAAAQQGAACAQTAPFTTPAAAVVTVATKEAFAADPVAPAYALRAGATAGISGMNWGPLGNAKPVTAPSTTTTPVQPAKPVTPQDQVPLAVTVSPTDIFHAGCPATLDVPTSSASQTFVVAILGTPGRPVSAIKSPASCYATGDAGLTKIAVMSARVTDVMKYNAASSTATTCDARGCAGTAGRDGLPDLLLTFKSFQLADSMDGQVEDEACSAANAMVTIVCDDMTGAFYVKTNAPGACPSSSSLIKDPKAKKLASLLDMLLAAINKKSARKPKKC